MIDVATAQRLRGLLAIAVVTLIWSLNFVLARPAAIGLDPVVLTWARASIAAAVFWLLFCRVRGLTRAGLERAIFPAVACIVCNQVLFLLSSRRTSPTHVALIVATIPVFVAIIARVQLGERLAPRRILGIGVAFIGVAWLATLRDVGGLTAPTMAGDLLALLAAMSFAMFTVLNKRLVQEFGAFPATTLVYVAGALLLTPPALARLVRGGGMEITTSTLLSATYLVVAATLIAYPLFSYALARLTASRVAVFTYLQPIGAAIISYALGWERFGILTLMAAAVVVGGVALAQRRMPEGSPTRSPDL